MRKGPLLGLVLVTAILVSFLPGLVHEYATLNYWQTADANPISQAGPGRTVKVVGTISSVAAVAFGPHEYVTSCRSGTCWEWDWNTSDSFAVSDSSGSILVTPVQWWYVTDGPHIATYIRHFHLTYYAPGDRVYVVGATEALANGTRVMKALIVSQENPSPPPLDSLIIGSIGATLVTSWSLVAAVRFRREQLNRESIGLRLPIRLESEPSEPDPSVNWLPNRLLVGRARRSTAIVAVAALAGWFPVVFLPIALTSHKDSDQVLLSGVALAWTSVFAGVPLAARLLTGGEKAEAVAVSDRGFHIWYRSPYARKLHDTLVPWNEIVNIVDRQRGRTTVHLLLRTDGEEMDLGFLRRDNLNALRTEWDRRRTTFLGPPRYPMKSKNDGRKA